MTSYVGLYQCRDYLVAEVVDLVVTPLSQHEHGVLAVPRQIMVPPQVDGRSYFERIKMSTAAFEELRD